MKIKRVDNGKPNEEEYIFWCEGCQSHHSILVRAESPHWTLTGTMYRPTILPSVRHTYTHNNKMCHYVITDGMMAFEGDSTHKYSGQTIEMTDLDDI